MKTLRAHIARLLLTLGAFALPLVAAADNGLQNPLNSQFSSIPAFLGGALQVLVMIALPIITLFVVIAGFMFVFARGNETKLNKAKENLIYVLVGALLILGASMLATLLGGTISQLLGS